MRTRVAVWRGAALATVGMALVASAMTVPAEASTAPAPQAAVAQAAALPAGRAVAVTRDSGDAFKLDLFELDSAGRIFERIQQIDPTTKHGTGWGPLTQIDGLLTSIAVAHNANGRITIVGTNSAGTVFYRTQTAAGSTTWTPWATLDGQLSRVALARQENGTILLIGLNSSGQIFTRAQTAPNATSWTAWTQLDGLLTELSVHDNNFDGSIVIVGVNSAGTIFTRSQTAPNAATWTGWTILDGLLSRVVLNTTRDDVHTGQNPLIMFGINSAGTLFTRTQTALGSLNWGPWTLLDGQLSQLTAEWSFDNPDFTYHLFGINSAGTVFERTQPSGGQWTPWTILNTLA